jgi:hypothetical protein
MFQNRRRDLSDPIVAGHKRIEIGGKFAYSTGAKK